MIASLTSHDGSTVFQRGNLPLRDCFSEVGTKTRTQQEQDGRYIPHREPLPPSGLKNWCPRTMMMSNAGGADRIFGIEPIRNSQEDSGRGGRLTGMEHDDQGGTGKRD